MKTEHTDVVLEYLHELDLRLSGLPVLQRRELLADLAAHVEAERLERNLTHEVDMIEVLERLGTPAAVAAAAYAEAGPLPPPVAPPFPPPAPPARASRAPYWLAAGVIGAVVLIVALCLGAFLLSRTSGPELTPVPAAPATR